MIGVDIKQADIVADLSTAEGRRAAANGVLASSRARLDGAVLAPVLVPGPQRGKHICLSLHLEVLSARMDR